MGTSHKAIRQKLEDLATGQHGFFTAGQAVDAGYADSVHSYHVQQGDWIKVWRGIYRLANVPEPEHSELTIWSLWSRGRNGVPQGVYSHETALRILGGLPWEGDELHMTVPTSFRRNSEIPRRLVLHKADLAPGDFEAREGFYITTAARTASDIAAGCTNPKILEAARNMNPQGSWLPGGTAVDDRTPVQTNRPMALLVDDWDYWDGPPPMVPQWSGGKSFEEALLSGED